LSIYAPNWKEIRRLLREVRSQLAPPSGEKTGLPVPVGLLQGTLDEFDEFLEHNELELAWDALANVAEHANNPTECWDKLAALMEPPEKRDAAQQRATVQVNRE